MQIKKHMIRRSPITLVVLFFLVISFNLNLCAQTPEKIKNLRIGYLSKKYKMNSSESQTLVRVIDETTQMMNRIFHDSTLTSSEKIKRIQVLEKQRDSKVKELIPDKSRLLFPIDIQRLKMTNK